MDAKAPTKTLQAEAKPRRMLVWQTAYLATIVSQSAILSAQGPGLELRILVIVQGVETRSPLTAETQGAQRDLPIPPTSPE